MGLAEKVVESDVGGPLGYRFFQEVARLAKLILPDADFRQVVGSFRIIWVGLQHGLKPFGRF